MSGRLRIGVAAWCAAVAVSLAVASGALAASAPVVSTHDGRVRGTVVGATDEFLGIPYAQPPVGALRWRAPQPLAPWTGVRAATTLPPACPQLTNGNSAQSTDENCLDLSVYRPRGVSAHARLPVLFWIFGGGLTTGAGRQYDGALFADTDHIEVVSINYRVGIFGFLALPSLDREAADHASGDYGLLDQIAALRWTHRNIARFGGDPSHLAIAGESAGAWSVCGLLASPQARGLYSRAIIQSGSCVSQSLATAQKAGTAFARSMGCRDTVTAAQCLRGKSVLSLLHDKLYPGTEYLVRGGAELPVAPATVIARGDFPHVPVLIGTNHTEGRTFAGGFAKDPESTYVSTLRTDYGAARAGRILAQYPWTSFPEPYRTAYALATVWTDSGFVGGIGGCATERLVGELSRRTPTFMYQFDDLHAPGLNRILPGYDWGAGHAMELAYMWPSFNNGYSLYDELDPAQRQLSTQMVRYWGAFVRAGDPDVSGAVTWPAFASGDLLSLRPGDATTPISSGEFAAEHECAFWNALPGPPAVGQP